MGFKKLSSQLLRTLTGPATEPFQLKSNFLNPQGIGSTQEDAIQEHQHFLQTQSSALTAGAQTAQPVMSPTGSSKSGNIVQMADIRVSDTETRAINIAVNFLIKTQ